MSKNPAILNREFQHPTDGWYHIEPLGEHPNAAAKVVQVIDAKASQGIVDAFNREADDYKAKHGVEFPGMLIDREHFSHDNDKETAADGAGEIIGLDWLGKKFNIPKPAPDEKTLKPAANGDAQPPKGNGAQPDDDEATNAKNAALAAEEAGHPFRGNQYTGGKPGDSQKEPPRISSQDADELLTKGFTEKDKQGHAVRFGNELKQKLDKQRDGTSRKELLNWGRDTVRTGDSVNVHVNGEPRTYYGKVYHSNDKSRGFMVIVDTEDGYAFNMHLSKPSQVDRKMKGKEGANTGEQPPAGVLQALAAAGGLLDWFNTTEFPSQVNTDLEHLRAIVALDSDAEFERALRAFAKGEILCH